MDKLLIITPRYSTERLSLTSRDVRPLVSISPFYISFWRPDWRVKPLRWVTVDIGLHKAIHRIFDNNSLGTINIVLCTYIKSKRRTGRIPHYSLVGSIDHWNKSYGSRLTTLWKPMVSRLVVKHLFLCCCWVSPCMVRIFSGGGGLASWKGGTRGRLGRRCSPGGPCFRGRRSRLFERA